MKNVQVIKQRLTRFKNSNQLILFFQQIPLGDNLNVNDKKKIEVATLSFIDKLVKHLDSKRPGRSSISNLLLRSFYKLQYTEENKYIPDSFMTIAVQVINTNFEGAFPDRLNVKSKEFIGLPDWDPRQE